MSQMKDIARGLSANGAAVGPTTKGHYLLYTDTEQLTQRAGNSRFLPSTARAIEKHVWEVTTSGLLMLVGLRVRLAESAGVPKNVIERTALDDSASRPELGPDVLTLYSNSRSHFSSAPLPPTFLVSLSLHDDSLPPITLRTRSWLSVTTHDDPQLSLLALASTTLQELLPHAPLHVECGGVDE